MMGDWSMESFCAIERQHAVADDSAHSETTRRFLTKLALPSIHPLCESNTTALWFPGDVPSMGPADIDYYNLHDGSIIEILTTQWHMLMPPFLSFSALWLLLFAAFIAPIGCLLLMKQAEQQHDEAPKNQSCRPSKLPMTATSSCICLSAVCFMTVVSSLAVMTDTLYVHDFGPHYGTGLFLLSSLLSLSICKHNRLRMAQGSIIIASILALYLSAWDYRQQHLSSNGHSLPMKATFDEGLYYNTQNPLVSRLVSLWDPLTRTYSPANGATRWMATGDVRTGLPFFLNKNDYNPEWVRVWLNTQTSPDQEVLALDIAFPKAGHDFSKPVYIVFHGLNGGSREGYVKDLTMRRNREGSTVVVMIARGMMDTPILSWNFFHGARLSDANDAALAVRKGLGQDQILVGVGYSMGAIVLNNYVATYGTSCALDAAFSISGALDCRYELNDARSKGLWQPLLADSMKTLFLFGKHGKKVRERLTNYEMVQLMRASSVVDVDRLAAVAYHHFDSVEGFYAAMSALGDIPQHDYYKNDSSVSGKIENVAIPLCVMHALDDPISTWRTVAANEGFMHPNNLVRSGQGNLMLLLTERGGHVGWPLGWLSQQRQWEFMSEAAAAFASAVMQAKQELRTGECSA